MDSGPVTQTQHSPEPGADAVGLLYPEVCKSHAGSADFRARLLALLPLASGSGIFLLLKSTNAGPTLTAAGVFGFVVTLGLFLYELRGIEDARCCALAPSTWSATGYTFRIAAATTTTAFRPPARVGQRDRCRMGDLHGRDGVLALRRGAWRGSRPTALRGVAVALGGSCGGRRVVRGPALGSD